MPRLFAQILLWRFLPRTLSALSNSVMCLFQVRVLWKSIANHLSVLSTASCKSDILRDQLAFAEDIEKPIVPIFLGELQMPAGFAYQLASTNSFSFVLHRKLSRQHGASSLTKTLKEVLRNPGGSAPPPYVGAAEAELKAAQAKVAALQQQLAEAQAIIRAQQQSSGPRQVQV